MKRIYSFLKRAVPVFILVIVVLVVIYAFLFRPFRVSDDGMAPTLHKGDYALYNIKAHPKRGDIIAFNAQLMPGHTFVGRVIGVPEDKIVLKDGYAFLNDKFLDEPYTLSPHSTWIYDEAILGKNCQEIIVPKDKLFVLGDNRERGAGSELLGFIDYKEIIGVRLFSYYPTLKFSSVYRDTSHDKDLIGKSSLDENNFIESVNKKRKEVGLQPLIHEEKLTESAILRAKNILKYNDTSYEATKSGYTFFEAWEDVGYKKNYGMEATAFGYYNAENLAYVWWDPDAKKSVLRDGGVSDVGAASFVVSINNCPQQINVVHFGGLGKQ